VTVKKVSNLAASVQARLQNHARASARPFQELLQYYAMERFLYRLSTTSYRARFVLKGALMLHVWDAPLARATKDVDFLGRLDNSIENLERVVREICAADVEADGMVFDPTTVKTERIKEDADYEGVRVRFVGLLGKARVAMQIDVGFGDVGTPSAQDITYPALLDFPPPALAGYPRETVVAEKFQAIVYLGTLNSRMKDFNACGFSRVSSPSTTRCSRRPLLPHSRIARPRSTSCQSRSRLTSPSRRRRSRRGPHSERSCRTPSARKSCDVVTFLAEFLLPIARAYERGDRFEQRWPPGGPWTTAG